VSELGALELSMADVQRIEDLVDREALGEVCRSFFELFGLPIRVFSNAGTLLADVHQQRAICTYVNGFDEGRAGCVRIVGEVRRLAPEGGEILHACFTGAVYRVVPIHYDGRRLGRFVVGPYLPAETRELPRSLLVIDHGIDAGAAKEHLAEMPRVRRETAEKITAHFSRVLDLILFSGHRAYLTSNMHLASVRSNFRELSEKTQRLQQAYDKLKELDRLKSNFLATMSHELRTPLTSIIGYSEMLASGLGGELNDEQQEFVETIRNKGDHLLELITSLLDMSKFEQGQLHLHRELVDTDKLLSDVLATALPQANKKGLVLERRATADLPQLMGDEVRLRQVLQNLVDNAIKFTPAGGHIVVGARGVDMGLEGASDDDSGFVLMAASQRGLELSVADTGIGIPADQLDRIFDAFYQVDGSATREHGGTGLGLSIVKKLVEAHGGSVRVESSPGRGSKFYVTLPESDDL
jgi:two-component system sensor histidine kinase BarA